MRVNMRQEPRRAADETYSITWQDEQGLTHSAEVQGVDSSPSGAAFRCSTGLSSGVEVFLQCRGGRAGYATVRHCTRNNSGFTIGVQLEGNANGQAKPASENATDYYEFLQISPKAEFATIQRVYRFLASRYHPDNPATGDSEKFLLLKHAFEVLSDPVQRAAYDATRETGDLQPSPTLESIDYMDGIEGEVNRRLAVLSVLYGKRRMSPEYPRVSLADLEKRMGFPREYLDFATWYLRSKKYVTKEDNSDFALTALGVDFVEANASKIPVLHKMLHGSYRKQGADSNGGNQSSAHRESFQLGPASPMSDDVSAPNDKEEN